LVVSEGVQVATPLATLARNLVTQNITLDGVIEATEGWFDPAGDDAEVDQ